MKIDWKERKKGRMRAKKIFRGSESTYFRMTSNGTVVRKGRLPARRGERWGERWADERRRREEEGRERGRGGGQERGKKRKQVGR